MELWKQLHFTAQKFTLYIYKNHTRSKGAFACVGLVVASPQR